MKPLPAETLPLVCVPDAIPAAKRRAHFRLIRELFENEAEDRIDVPGGYQFRFPATSFDALSRFLSNERRCCPFLSFELTVEPADRPIRLKITGPDGTREFLDAAVRLLAAAAR